MTQDYLLNTPQAAPPTALSLVSMLLGILSSLLVSVCMAVCLCLCVRVFVYLVVRFQDYLLLLFFRLKVLYNTKHYKKSETFIIKIQYK